MGMTGFLAGWVPSGRMAGKVLVSCPRQNRMADRSRRNRILEILSDRQYRRSMIMSCDISCRAVCAHAKRLPSPGNKHERPPPGRCAAVTGDQWPVTRGKEWGEQKVRGKRGIFLPCCCLLPESRSRNPESLFPDDDLLFEVDPVLQPAQHVHAEQSVISRGRAFVGNDKDIPVAFGVRPDG